MQPRLNKKGRKGRNNPNNRERTVTTLTEDPNSSYLVPKSSEEPPNSALMSSSFNVPHNQQAQINTPNNVMNQYQMQANAGNFGYGYNNAFGMGQAPAATMHQQPQQPFYTTPQGVRIPGENDLEILQNLKQMILDGQHPVFRPIPQPASLARLYLGPSAQAASTSQVPPHPEQSPTMLVSHDVGQIQLSNSSGSSMPSSAVSGPQSPADVSRRPPRMQNKEGWDPSGPRRPPQAQNLAQQASLTNNAAVTNNIGQELSGARNTLSNINTSNLANTAARPDSSGPSSVIVKSESGDLQSALKSATQESPSGRGRYDGPPSARAPPSPREPHSYNRPSPNDVSPLKGYYDGKEDIATMEARRRMPPPGPPDDRRYSHPYDDRDRDRDRSLPPRTADMSMNVDRVPGAPDDRYERDRERDRYRYRDWPERDRERDYRAPPPPPGTYDRYSRPPYSDSRRPSAEYERKRYEPELADPTRRVSDVRGPPSVDAHLQSGTSLPPVDDRGDRPGAPPSMATRGIPSDVRPVDSRAADPRGPPPTSGSTAPPPTSGSDTRVSSGAPSLSGGGAGDERGVRPPSSGTPRAPETASNRPSGSSMSIASTAPELNRDPRAVDAPRPQVPLEDRISRTPSLQDRLSGSVGQQQAPPAPGRPEPERPRLEDRLALSGNVPPSDHRPPAAVERDTTSITRTVGPTDDRDRPADDSAAAPGQDRVGRPTENRYTRHITPLPNEAAVPPMHRSSYPAPPPRAASVVRDDRSKAPSPPAARPPPFRPREPSRERHEPARGNYVRPYDDRRPDAMDVDIPARYPDNGASYRRPYSPVPPPGAETRDRDRTRPPSTYPPSPRGTVDPTYDDRRYTPSASREWYPPYDRRSRDWSQAEEDAYWKSRGYPPPAERESYNRDAPPASRTWEPRPADRDPREYPPPSAPSPRAYDRAPSSYPPSAAPPTDDRGYPVPPREIDRTRGGPPPPAYAGRVRPRTPSPIRRPPIDDPRPPMKRAREEYPPAEYSYPPSAREPVRSEYPPRAGGPMGPPPSSAGYYERPPPSSSAAPGPDRDYPPRERGSYPPPPAGYERPRSPGRPPASYNRAPYSRPPDPRDRDYMPPPSRPA